MTYSKLGNTGLFVSRIGLGTMLFGASTPKNDAIWMMNDFLAKGGNHIDTANVYGPFLSEETIGESLQKLPRDEIVLATKLRFAVGKTANAWGLSRKHIMNEVEQSLRRLQTDYIDLLYVHCWDDLTPIEETLMTLDDLIGEGKLRYIGVSNFKAWQLMKSHALSEMRGLHRFCAAQFQYSLVDRNIELEVTEACEETGLGLVPWAPLGGGFLTGKYQRGRRPKASEGRIGNALKSFQEYWDWRNTEKNWRIIDAMTNFTKKYDTTYTRIALAWLLTKENVSSVLIGPRTREQYEDNMKGIDLHMDDDDIAVLDELSAPNLVYPYSFIEMLLRRVPGIPPKNVFAEED